MTSKRLASERIAKRRGGVLKRYLIPREEWEAAFKDRQIRRQVALTAGLGLLATGVAVVSTLGDPSQLTANLILGSTLVATVAIIARWGVRAMVIIVPAVCVAFGFGFILSTYATLFQVNDPKEMATFTRWTPIGFFVNAMCFRPAGARWVSGLTTFGVLAFCTAWLFQPGNFNPKQYNTAAVVLTYFVLGMGMLIQEISFAVRERRAGQFSAARQSLVDLRRQRAIERELRAVQDDIMRINRVSIVNAMATTIAHEIKQPLAAAVNFAHAAHNWLDRSPPNLARAEESVGKLQAEVLRARDIIEEIRLMTSRQESMAAELELVELMRQAADLIAGEATKRGVRVELNFDLESGWVSGRKIQLQQALINLMNNALEAFDGQAAPHLRLSLRREPDGFEIVVADNGPGIPAERMASVQRGLYTTKAGGTGLGVAICRQIIEQHGGLLDLESSASGTSVRIRLPTMPVPHAAEAAA